MPIFVGSQSRRLATSTVVAFAGRFRAAFFGDFRIITCGLRNIKGGQNPFAASQSAHLDKALCTFCWNRRLPILSLLCAPR